MKRSFRYDEALKMTRGSLLRGRSMKFYRLGNFIYDNTRRSRFFNRQDATMMVYNMCAREELESFQIGELVYVRLKR